MQFKLFCIPAAGDRATEDELNLFLRTHRAVSVQRELVQCGSGAAWCFCVEYLLGSQATSEQPAGGRRRVDYKERLSDNDFRLFARLRELRKQLAAQETVPVYAICTNEHLAEIAKSRPASLSELKKIEGFGEAKAEKYGQSVLEAVRAFLGTQTEAGDATSGATG